MYIDIKHEEVQKVVFMKFVRSWDIKLNIQKGNEWFD